MKFQLLIKTKMLEKKKIFLAYKLSDVLFIKLINVKMLTIVDILTFISMINFMLRGVEHEKSFITSEPGVGTLSITAALFFCLCYCFTSKSTILQ